ncbi:MAG: hypothetical protein ACRDQD_00695 [Nocardioidaceae bacterium]
MAMTMTEADHVNKLIAFIVHGDVYTGQADPARTAAQSLEYLGDRAAKVLQVNRRGDVETYARRLQPLARSVIEEARRDLIREHERGEA